MWKHSSKSATNVRNEVRNLDVGIYIPSPNGTAGLTFHLDLILSTFWLRNVLLDSKVFDAVVSKSSHGRAI